MKNTSGNTMLKKHPKKKLRDTLFGWLFCSPYMIFCIVLFIIPLIWAFWLATMDWNLMSSRKTFVGLANFKEIFTDKEVAAAFHNSLKYLFFVVTLSVSGGIVIALLVNRLPKRLKGISSVLFFVPYLTSGVAASVMVRYMFSYNSALNTMLRNSFDIDINWFADKKAAFAVIVMTVVWKLSGYYALFMSSAIQGISDDVKEAAALDGSKGLHKLLHITLPMTLPTLTTIITLATGTSLSIYTEPFLLTEGGPANATTTWTLEVYIRAFTKFDSGYGSAMAIIFALQIFIILRLINTGMGKLNAKYGV